MRRKKSYISRFGKMLAKRDAGWYCHYCHIPISRNPQPAKDIRQATVDHRLAKARGAEDNCETKNMVLSCDVCNQRKGTTSYAAFMKRTANERRKRPKSKKRK